MIWMREKFCYATEGKNDKQNEINNKIAAK
jgi:hypothetical protein